MMPVKRVTPFRSAVGLCALLLVARPTSAAEGADDATVKLFKAQCSSCHGVDGKGKTTIGKKNGVRDWTDGKTLKAMSDAQIRQLLREGKKGDDGKQKMPGFKKLSDAQIDALIKYVRELQR